MYDHHFIEVMVFLIDAEVTIGRYLELNRTRLEAFRFFFSEACDQVDTAVPNRLCDFDSFPEELVGDDVPTDDFYLLLIQLHDG